VLIKNLDDAALAALSVLSNRLIVCIFSEYPIRRYFVKKNEKNWMNLKVTNLRL